MVFLIWFISNILAVGTSSNFDPPHPSESCQRDTMTTLQEATINPSAIAGLLAGLRIVELAGIGPGPFAAMLLADLGAEVIRVDRPGDHHSTIPPHLDALRRSRKSIVLDLRSADGVATVLNLIEKADVLIEGFRPGVTERLRRFRPRPAGSATPLGLWTDDRMGPDRTVVPYRRSPTFPTWPSPAPCTPWVGPVRARPFR